MIPVGLVLIGDDETALECFESLIHLAKEQLNHISSEKSKLPSLTPEERAEMYRRVCKLCLYYICDHDSCFFLSANVATSGKDTCQTNSLSILVRQDGASGN